MDLGTGLAILGGKDLIQKVLGPTADYIGTGLKEFTEKRANNIKSIFENAEKKLENNKTESGRVNPKVLKGILDDGSYAEDPLNIEYFGGVLASSKTNVDRDDRGVYFNNIIRNLTTYQLRLHYSIYKSIKELYDKSEIDLGLGNEYSKLKIFISFNTMNEIYNFSEEEIKFSQGILDNTIHGLDKEQLISSHYYGGPLDTIKKYYKDAPSDGFVFQPNKLGFELFLWAHGFGTKGIRCFFQPEIQFETDIEIKLNNIQKVIEQ